MYCEVMYQPQELVRVKKRLKSGPVIGRELPPKIFKGGTLTVQNLCLKYLLHVRYITSRVNRVRHITSRVKRVGYITSRVKLYQEFPYRSPFVKCVSVSRVV